MYSFLGEHQNRVLRQVDSQNGMLELDFSDEDHYKFFLDHFGGKEGFEEKHPDLVEMLETMRTSFSSKSDHPLTSSSPMGSSAPLTSEYHSGPDDLMAIENLIFKSQPQISRTLDSGSNKKTMARVTAEYTKKKKNIRVVSTLYDVTNDQLLHTIAGDIKDSYRYQGAIEAEFQQYYQEKPREMMIKSLFYCTDYPAESTARVAMLSGASSPNSTLRAYVAKQSAFTIRSNTDIVKSFKLNDPVIQPKNQSNPAHTEVKISYVRNDSIPDYDYENKDNPFVDGKNTKIMVRLKFSATLEAAPGYYIEGLNEEQGYRLWLKNMVNGTVNHYGNFEDIIQQKNTFDDQNRCTKMTFIFPEKWNNILDFEKVGYKVYTEVDLYASFVVMMQSQTDPDELALPVALSVKSDGKPGDYDLLNIECKKIYIQWGCVGRETEFMLADGSVKRADEIMMGDHLRDVNGASVQVKRILTGSEYRLYDVQTANHRVRVTPNHTMSTDQGLLMAIELEIGMNLNTVDGPEPITSLEWSTYEDTVYNFEFEQETLLVGNGIIIGDSMLQNRKREVIIYEA